MYVLGMLPEDEASKIEQLAKLFPEIQEELDRISEALQGFAATSSVAPSPSVKQDLMAKFREMKLAEESEDSERVVPLYKEEKGSDVNMAPVVPLPTRKVQLPFWAAASLIGFVLSLGALIYLFSENKKSRTELAEARQQVDTLQNRFSQQQQEMTAYSQTLQMMQNGEYKKIELSSLPGKTAAQAQVMWNTKTHEVFLADVSLPAPPTGKQYQLWAIVDGKPVDAGLMSDVKHVAQKMKTFDRADAFAISIENKGGNPTPTEVYMMGKV